MKIKVLLMAFAISIGVFEAYAQKGVDTGTQFGSGEDSLRCITNISLFTPYARSNNYADALPFWQIVYDECPAATRDIYLYGVRIVNWQISNEQDPAKKEELINKLMEVYDKRVIYFGDDARYPKDWIVARKAQDYIAVKGESADNKLLYGWLKEVIDEKGEACDPLAVNLFVFTSLRRMLADPDFKEQYIADYMTSAAIYEAQIKGGEASGSDVENVVAYKQAIDNQFATSGAADCETLQSMYAPKIEENKENMEYLKEVLTLLRRLRCNEIDAYIAASRYVHVNEPTAASAAGLARQAIKDDNYTLAIQYLEEAANLDEDPMAKADDYYAISQLLYSQNNFSRSRQYALRALEFNPNYGKAYILIGQMYASSARSIFPNDGVLAKAVYNVAIDKFERAKQVDPESATEANGLIATYRQHLPTTEEIFMHPDLEKGKAFTVGGWINERTTIR
jgi:tetratricopeptide (TPR) repeat protein